jgi:flagellar protein FlgJ
MNLRPIQGSLPGDLGNLGPTGALPEKPLAPTSDPNSPDRAKFKKAAVEFESFLLYYMLKTMRQAIPKSGLVESKAGDTYLSLFDQEVANLAAKQGGFGLAKAIETQFFPASPVRSSSPAAPPIRGTEEEER